MNPTVLRLLDANANRAREALRVVEDYARFALDDDGMSQRLKDLRHEFARAVGPHLPGAILYRDTTGDVGTDNKTQSEGSRAGLNAIVIAAGKRLGEALRVTEECLKTRSASDARAVEQIRYGWYVLEQEISYTFRDSRFGKVRLYVLITESLCKSPWLTVAKQAIEGGANAIQLREKTLESGELLQRATALVELCRSHNVTCIINDRPDIAVLSKADGVHVGQDDLPAKAARRIVGPDILVGVSTHNLDQAIHARLDGADYIGVGPFFRSSTKPREILPGAAYAREIAQSMPDFPSIAIAGITPANVDEVLKTGIRAVAVSSAVIGADDVTRATREIKEKLTPVSERN